jgi:hypothetical protein
MIRTKDQAVKHIQDFCVESELKHNNKVEQIQTDNAGETFHSHAYREWCTKNNIKFVANVPEMHGSMGKIDKAIQDSSRSTIIMLLFSNLTPGFWALAAKYHAHTREFIPSLGSATGLPPVVATRPDIQTAVNILATRSNIAEEKDWFALVTIRNYLANTANLRLALGKRSNTEPLAFADSSYCTEIEWKSRAGGA